MDEREPHRDEDRLVAILLSGGPRSERLREVIRRTYEVEEAAWQRIVHLAGKVPEMMGPDDVTAMQSSAEQGQAAAAERRSAIREILEEERRDPEDGGEGGSY